MNYKDTPYFKAGSAADLTGSDRRLFRFFECVPAIVSWGTILITLVLSWLAPSAAAVFLIMFNFYWVLKSLYLSVHLRQNWRRVKHNLKLDWQKMLEPMQPAADKLIHLVIFPFYKEDQALVEKSIESLLACRTDAKKMYVVLAAEERAGEEARHVARAAEEKFSSRFGGFLVTVHPKDIEGEIPGKGSNISYAAEEARTHLLDTKAIRYDRVLVSAFDIDTMAFPDYFACLEWHFLTAPSPLRVSYQPVPLYNNNMWQAPALSRVVATSGSFWQMIQQERPERLTTFSSHSMPFQPLREVGYWQKNIVSEDSRIFWNCFAAYDGAYSVVPLSYPVSMDANLASTSLQTLVNVYKQQRRWSWGAENLPYVFMTFVKNKTIPLRRKISLALIEVERAWSLATNPLLLFILNWFPIILGGHRFNSTVLSYNLPILSRYMTVLGMAGIMLSAIISLSFLPPPPEGKKEYHRLFILAQWLLIPISLIVFGSLPTLDAQTRLLLGGRFRLGFWVTPKHRKA